MEGMNGSSISSRRPRSTASQRARWAQRFFQSGLSAREFALQHRLGLSTLQRWVALSRAQAGAPALVADATFAEVKLPPVARAPGWAAEVLRPDGSTLRLAHDVAPALLRQLLRAC
jgi:hypothetical protein